MPHAPTAASTTITPQPFGMPCAISPSACTQRAVGPPGPSTPHGESTPRVPSVPKPLPPPPPHTALPHLAAHNPLPPVTHAPTHGSLLRLCEPQLLPYHEHLLPLRRRQRVNLRLREAEHLLQHLRLLRREVGRHRHRCIGRGPGRLRWRRTHGLRRGYGQGRRLYDERWWRLGLRRRGLRRRLPSGHEYGAWRRVVRQAGGGVDEHLAGNCEGVDDEGKGSRRSGRELWAQVLARHLVLYLREVPLRASLCTGKMLSSGSRNPRPSSPGTPPTTTGGCGGPCSGGGCPCGPPYGPEGGGPPYCGGGGPWAGGGPPAKLGKVSQHVYDLLPPTVRLKL